MSATEPIVCPRCGHARTASDDAPAWECPRCGIVHRKYRAHLDQVRRLTTPPGSGEAMPHWTADGSIWSLVAANLIGIGAAIYQFGTLKAAADVAMHVAEHAQLRKVRAGEPPGQVPQDRAPPPS